MSDLEGGGRVGGDELLDHVLGDERVGADVAQHRVLGVPLGGGLHGRAGEHGQLIAVLGRVLGDEARVTQLEEVARRMWRHQRDRVPIQLGPLVQLLHHRALLEVLVPQMSFVFLSKQLVLLFLSFSFTQCGCMLSPFVSYALEYLVDGEVLPLDERAALPQAQLGQVLAARWRRARRDEELLLLLLRAVVGR